MKIIIAKSEKEFDCIAAWQIIGEILNKPEAVIGLSTGRTTGNLHRMVGEIYSRYPFNTSAVTFFGLDEVVNVPREYAGACYTMLKTEIIDALGIKDENFLMLPTVSDDFGKACRAFQEEIAKRGGIDLLILGYGLLFGTTVINVFAYRGVELKVTPMIESTGIIWVTILAVFFLGERPTKRGLLSIAVTVLGIIVFSL